MDRAPGLDRLKFGLGDVGAPEEPWAEGTAAVAAHEEVDVADVVGLEDDDERRRAGIEPHPHLVVVLGRSERVEQRHLAAGLDAGRADALLPADPRPPVGVREPPDPETGRDVCYRQTGSEGRVIPEGSMSMGSKTNGAEPARIVDATLSP